MMKQLAIGEVRVKGVSNHLDATVEKHKRGDLTMGLARWWFVTDYAPMGTNAQKTVFRIQGPHIKLLNEEMLLARDGSKIGKGNASKPDQFSVDFTAAFPDLETKFASFSDLRNLFDLVLVATLLQQLGVIDWFDDTVLLNEEVWPTPLSVIPREAEPLAALSFHRGKNEGGRGVPHHFSVAYGGVSMTLGTIQFDGGKSAIDPAVKGPEDPSSKTADLKPEGEDSEPDESSTDNVKPATSAKKPSPTGTKNLDRDKQPSLTKKKENSWWVDLKPAESK